MGEDSGLFMTTSTHLVRTRRFLPLFVTQLLGAFNDNLFKNAMVLFVVYKNMAALDSLYERMEPLAAKAMGPRQKRADAAVSREAMREVLGDRYIRELILK